jgi:hypothetical protein
METSLLKTLACKYRSTVRKMSRKYRATVETPHGPRRCLQVTVERKEGKKPLVARFGGIPLKRERTATLADVRPVTAPAYNELIKTAPGRVLRALRDPHGSGGPPHPPPRRPQTARTSGQARLDPAHGPEEAQDVCALPDLPCLGPCRARFSATADVTTGERNARKRCAVSLGAGSPPQGAEVRKEMTLGLPA